MPTQRLSLTQNVTASGSGTATFTFPAPPTDLVWIGTLVCNQAPASAALTPRSEGGARPATAEHRRQSRARMARAQASLSPKERADIDRDFPAKT